MNLKVSVKNSEYYPQTLQLKWLLAIKKRLIRLIAGAIIGVFFLVQHVLPISANVSRYLGIAFLLLIVVVLLRSWIAYSLKGNKWLKLNKDANTDIEINFTDNGIFFKDYRGTTPLDWNKFKLYQRFAGYLFIMEKHPGDAITFKESLLSLEEMNELLQFINNKLGTTK